jgi:hypothetical protein
VWEIVYDMWHRNKQGAAGVQNGTFSGCLLCLACQPQARKHTTRRQIAKIIDFFSSRRKEMIKKAYFCRQKKTLDIILEGKRRFSSCIPGLGYRSRKGVSLTPCPGISSREKRRGFHGRDSKAKDQRQRAAVVGVHIS